jgi:two-component system chemotaxis response regulator CheY
MMKPKNVLIVDDSESMRQILRRVLEGASVHVFEAPRAKDGMQILLQGNIDLLITDWNMLEMDGLEFTRVLRSISTFEHLPILMLSNNDTDESRVEALLAGVDIFVSKCTPFDHLRDEVTALLAGSRPSRRQSRGGNGVGRKSLPGAASALLLGFTDEAAEEIRDLFGRLGFRGFRARDAWEGLAHLQQIAGVELLVVEWAKLRPDYLNMILQIQQDPRWREIRVLVLNSPWAPPMARPGSPAEAHMFLRADCSLDDLREALRSMGLKPRGAPAAP